LEYLQRLAPKPRHARRLAIRALAQKRGDIKPLTNDLEGFCRLRVSNHRVIFEYEMVRRTPTITCVFAGPRKWIYEVFQSRLME
jgi:mRNA-degrading endonuclease RelE of RelBE toxin-antitoxin system